MIFNKRFILASNSKSRFFILKKNKLSFRRISPTCDEELIKKQKIKKKISPKTISLCLAKSKALSIFLFFFVGLYGGFIQAGVGFLVIATLAGIHGLSMVKTNSIKSFVIVCYTAVALVIFILEDQIRWDYGLTLAAGNSVGAWVTSRWSVNVDDKWVRLFLLITVIGMAVKLWFFS